MVKKVLNKIVWSLTAVCIILLFVLGRRSYLNAPLKDINISIERKHDKGFVLQDITMDKVKELCDTTQNRSIRQIDLLNIGNTLENNPWIESASTYIDLDKTLQVEIKEYEPVLRAYNASGNSVYLTEEGVIIPESQFYTPRVLIASGNFNFPITNKTASLQDSIYAQSGLNDILQIYKEVEKDAFLKACIGQIYRNANNEYEITLNYNETKVLLGKINDLSDKLLRMKLFYKQKSGTEELSRFKEINIKYKNQIVCTKY